MTSKERHQKIADQFANLNKTLDKIHMNYLEKISLIINKAVKKHTDKELWNTSYSDVVDLIYAALTETYLETTTTLRDIYEQISDKILDIKDFIYKDDKLTLSERIKGYWDETKKFLKNPNIDSQDMALKLLIAYDRILTNEMVNVKTGVKKAKKPVNINDGIEVIEITDGECCHNGGVYLAEDNPTLPPYHIGCQCDYWYDFYYPTNEYDLKVLQEAGWEEDDG